MNEHRTRVDPHLIFGISLFVALAVTWPTLAGAMHGRVDIVTAGVHLLVAIAIAWTGCYGVGSLMHGYAHGAGTAAGPPAPGIEGPQRRAADAAPAALTTPSDVAPSLAIDAGAADAA